VTSVIRSIGAQRLQSLLTTHVKF